MTLLQVSKKWSATRPLEALELKLQEAVIVFDQEKRAILAPGQRIENAPGPQGVGYLQATDEEINLLREAGYSLPDWRKLSISDLRRQYPDWSSK